MRIENVLPTKSLEFFISTPHWLDAFTPPLEKHLQRLTEIVRYNLAAQSGASIAPEFGRSVISEKYGKTEPQEYRQDARRSTTTNHQAIEKHTRHRKAGRRALIASSIAGVALIVLAIIMLTGPFKSSSIHSAGHGVPATTPHSPTTEAPAADRTPVTAPSPPATAQSASSIESKTFEPSITSERQPRTAALTSPTPPVLEPAPPPAPMSATSPSPSSVFTPSGGSPAITPMDPHEMARQLQAELHRVGCYSGGIDGSWGPSSSDALRRFNEHAKTDLNFETANAESVDVVRARTGRICPLVCGPGETPHNNRCVAARRERPQEPINAIPPAQASASTASTSSPSIPPKEKRCLSVFGSTYCE
jgi:hypothetical protein